jgi:hypothetical protein
MASESIPAQNSWYEALSFLKSKQAWWYCELHDNTWAYESIRESSGTPHGEMEEKILSSR